MVFDDCLKFGLVKADVSLAKGRDALPIYVDAD